MSNWENTVMSKAQLLEINNQMPSEAKYGEVFEVIAEKQAEITWDIARQGGRKEVVEWIEENSANFDLMNDKCFGRDEWQFKLKEWGCLPEGD